MSDYTKMKVPDLQSKLKSLSLPHTGVKADLIARLEEHDQKATAKATTSTLTPAAASAPVPAAPPPEDEIDWDAPDEDNTTVAAATTAPPKPSSPGSAALAMGGRGRAANPLAVPNQVPAIDPSQTADLVAIEPDGTTTTAEDTPAKTAALKEVLDAEEAEKPPPVDYTAGIAATDLDREIQKRKDRAAKFGIKESDEDAQKALERAKKFGTGIKGEKEAGAAVMVKGLDEALPERRKRGRGDEREEGGERGGKRRENGGGRGGRGRRDQDRSERRNDRRGAGRGEGAQKNGGGGGGGGFSEADKAKMAARAKKFASTAA
ncbi:MAG: hypothetical protein M1827_001015 [Pycnora praestabilis]|nr:MAG: hypothetical protein M1827_001015 [Pycnora praestabilis]